MALGMHLKAGICILEGRSQCWKLQLQRPCCRLLAPWLVGAGGTGAAPGGPCCPRDRAPRAWAGVCRGGWGSSCTSGR